MGSLIGTLGDGSFQVSLWNKPGPLGTRNVMNLCEIIHAVHIDSELNFVLT